MKKLIYIIISLILTSCELEMTDNGALDGNWQLRQIDTLSTGGTCDMSRSYIYWAVQNDLLQVRDIDNADFRILFRFEKKGDHLTLRNPYHIIIKAELEPIEDIEQLTPYGIMGTEDTFTFENLSSGNMTLKNEFFRLHFRKY